MRKLSNWMAENPWQVIVYMLIGCFIFALTLSLYSGCAPRPRRFENGDSTVFGPRPYGDVVEPDMVKPQATE